MIAEGEFMYQKLKILIIMCKTLAGLKLMAMIGGVVGPNS